MAHSRSQRLIGRGLPEVYDRPFRMWIADLGRGVGDQKRKRTNKQTKRPATTATTTIEKHYNLIISKTCELSNALTFIVSKRNKQRYALARYGLLHGTRPISLCTVFHENICKSSILFISSKRVKLVPRVLLNGLYSVSLGAYGTWKNKSLLISEFDAF